MSNDTRDQLSADPMAELEAMKAVHAAVGALQPDAQGRVLQWVISALSLNPSMLSGSRQRSGTDIRRDSGDAQYDGNQAEDSDATTYSAFADLLGDAQPQTDAEKALVGGYWFQVVSGAEDFTSQAVNDKLKDTGEAVGNITRAFDRLKAAKPQLVRQLQKTGKTQQARKKLKLTTAGVEQVQRMLRGEK